MILYDIILAISYCIHHAYYIIIYYIILHHIISYYIVFFHITQAYIMLKKQANSLINKQAQTRKQLTYYRILYGAVRIPFHCEIDTIFSMLCHARVYTTLD